MAILTLIFFCFLHSFSSAALTMMIPSLQGLFSNTEVASPAFYIVCFSVSNS